MFHPLTISKSIKNICVWKNTNIHLHSYAKHRYWYLYDSTLWFAETLRSKNQARTAFTLHALPFFTLDACSLIFVARACLRAKCIARNLQNARISIAVLRRRYYINSYRKLIQDNYPDEMLKHINCWRICHGSLHLSHCTIARCVVRVQITDALHAIFINVVNILHQQSSYYRTLVRLLLI